jgi:hypothetical protein
MGDIGLLDQLQGVAIAKQLRISFHHRGNPIWIHPGECLITLLGPDNLPPLNALQKAPCRPVHQHPLAPPE